MWKKCLALALAVLTLPACAACNTKQGPFQFARRVLTQYDLSFNNKGEPIVEPGEVLVFFVYMKTLDAEAAQAGAASNTMWAAEAVTHAASLEYIGDALQKSEATSNRDFFTREVEYDFGIAATETWVLPEVEYKAAHKALMAAAREAAAADGGFWLMNGQGKGQYSRSLDAGISFSVLSYLPEQLRPRAQAVHMTTELMHEYFPFLGRK